MLACLTEYKLGSMENYLDSLWFAKDEVKRTTIKLCWAHIMKFFSSKVKAHFPKTKEQTKGNTDGHVCLTAGGNV